MCLLGTHPHTQKCSFQGPCEHVGLFCLKTESTLLFKNSSNSVWESAESDGLALEVEVVKCYHPRVCLCNFMRVVLWAHVHACVYKAWNAGNALGAVWSRQEKGSCLCITLWIFLARAGQRSQRPGKKRNFCGVIYCINSLSLIYSCPFIPSFPNVIQLNGGSTIVTKPVLWQ